jgi:hypothetical protein
MVCRAQRQNKHLDYQWRLSARCWKARFTNPTAAHRVELDGCASDALGKVLVGPSACAESRRSALAAWASGTFLKDGATMPKGCDYVRGIVTYNTLHRLGLRVSMIGRRRQCFFRKT